MREARTYKRFNVLESPQGPVVEMAGRGEVIVLSSNNYLGLAAHPEVVRAGIEGLERYGAGTASVRFICGTFEAHHELESKLSGSATEAALTYVSCWNANEAVIPTLTDETTVILTDEAQPREHHRRGPPLAAGAEGHLPALGRRCHPGRARCRPARGSQADRHGRRVLDGGRPGGSCRRSSSRARVRRGRRRRRLARRRRAREDRTRRRRALRAPRRRRRLDGDAREGARRRRRRLRRLVGKSATCLPSARGRSSSRTRFRPPSPSARSAPSR